MSRFHQKQVDIEKAAFRQHYEEQERCQRQLQEQRLKLIRQFKQQQLRNSETLAKIQSVSTLYFSITNETKLIYWPLTGGRC